MIRFTPAACPRIQCGFGVVMALMALAAGTPGHAAEPAGVSIELNKLEPQGKGCRTYIVIDNASDAMFQALKLDLIFFRTDGVIDRRLLIDLAPVRAAKKSVKIFDLDALPCEGIGSLLVNEATECRDAAGPIADCIDRLKFSSRAGVPFSK